LNSAGHESPFVPPAKMRAVVLLGHGGFDQLALRTDVDVPAPAAGEVLIRVAAAGINNTDINARTGWYSKSVAAGDAGWTGEPFVFPRIQGADACGYIAAVGAGVSPGRVGERVLVDPVLRSAAGPAGFFGSDRDGAFAGFATIPAGNAIGITSGLTDAQLASFPCSYGAAENMLARAGVTAGMTVLVTGASGGVGSAAVQLGRRRGAVVIAMTSAAKSAEVAALGAARVLPRDADLLSALGRGAVDAVIDVVGGSGFPALLEVLRRGGCYAVAGAIAGARVELDLRTLYLRDLRMEGCTITRPEVFRALVGYIEREEIRPLVSATYPLAEIVAAQRQFLAKAHTGKIVLIP
jgi:NADPH:quinone reductase-like Zn-dependent oxidoreductase